MNPFTLVTPAGHEEAAEVVRSGDYRLPVLKSGGMDVVDHMKEGLWAPDALVNLKDLRSGEPVRRSGERVEIDASTTMAMIARDPVVRRTAPVVAAAVGDAATPQVRNVGTAAGNLLQRPRCWYYRQQQFDCLKKGGDRCYAVEGENRYHAIFGGASCHIVHPSNLAPALYVTDGRVHLVGGDRSDLPIDELYHGPVDGVRSEHELEPHEVITHVSFAPAPRSGFWAIKEKKSFDWPLVMAAAALELDGDVIRSARVCAGAVAPVPWPLPAVERALAGVSLDDAAGLRTACAVATEGARPMSQNAYKVRLVPVAVRRAVLAAAGRPVEGLV